MNKLWWRAAWGLCLVQLSLAQIDLNITCRYAGVFHVEKNGRYSISRTEAADLCKAFNSTLPTLAQMEKALSVGFETCRYGFIEGHVVIPRIVPVSICAANNTGVYILTSNTSQYDTYCFNASAPADKEDCTSVTDLPNTFEGPITITIVNRDGTRYSKKGEYRTNPEDINPSNPTDDDVSSGSSSERTTSGGYNIFHTHLPTADPTKDQASPWVTDDTGDTPATITSTLHSNNHAAAQEQNGWLWSWFGNSQPKTQDVTTAATTALTSTTGTTPETITKREEVKDWFSQWFQPSHSKNHLHTTTKMAGTDSNTMSAGWDPNEENEDETGKPPSYSGSGIDDDEDFISRTISTITPAVGNTGLNEDWKYWSPQFPHQELELQTPTEMTDVDRSGTSAHGENWTQEPQPPLIHREHHDDEETQHSTRTTQVIPSITTEETATKKEQWFGNGGPGEHPQIPEEDSHSTTGTTVTTASAHDSHTNQRMTTQSQEDSTSWMDFFDPISHPMGRGHRTGGRMDMDSSHSTTLQPTTDPDGGLDLDRTGPLAMATHRNDGRGGRRGENLPEDSTTSVEVYTPHFPDTKENRTLTPVTPAQTGSPGVTEVTVVGGSNSDVAGSFPGHQNNKTGKRSHTTHGSESAGHSSGSQEDGANTTANPIRKAQIPEWLIILASLLALALILAVCIAVNSRRRCGQKKKLVINNGNGAVEDRKPSGLNGEASKSQEMVHLVNKEPSETPDQCMTADETRNLQNVDVKIGM
ncbi:CD44 antigen isoform X2 [Trichechus manatus latirostris]|uniref:CD44 antigen n=1 Tax=Trichechus manatus latirostris TaxID=127582 RepID=A0A2Y9RR52_TRIMA|nr:CD44 antigen isoform X2 [Trichechus manatus latirostris]